MAGKISLDDLSDEVKQALGLPTASATPPSRRSIAPRLFAFGNLIQSLRGLNHKDAVWALKKALAEVELSARSEGYKDRSNGKKGK